MLKNCALLLLALICFRQIGDSLQSSEERDPAEVGKQAAELVLERIFDTADVSDNFLIAPQEIVNIVEKLKADYDSAPAAYIQASDRDQHIAGYELPAVNRVAAAQKLLIDSPADTADHNGIIKKFEIINQPAGTSTAPQLLNKVTFEARWRINFHKRDSHKRLFHATPVETVYADAMRKDDMFRYADLDDMNATALELSLQRDEYKILIVLPDEVTGLTQLWQQFKANLSLIDEIVENRLRPTLVRVCLPKFKIAHQVQLNQAFEELFSFTSTGVVQKATIQIGEDGVGPLRNKMVLFWNAYSSVRIQPVLFDASHPFLFFIRNQQGDIQFIGVLHRLS